MKHSKTDLIIFAIAMIFIFFSGRLEPNVRLIITGLLIVVILINRGFSPKKGDKKEVKKE
ncbi:hypothetical protein Desde_2268 [Desulfitobacterium dehalogenans ATCC 51507]|uniref:Uncharacterized protein n=1 Tax=Desulfitobacterium dehalogenans (strain ATCC 51507 / DSM 9161 / JW/IU-DC1) TaxID=756499 RepID=I4A9H8_DESDJ|nr:hypothetical protein [Desulfitobacterium dehalogenans]AFM00613.1 hypothetical protein Desde_2268 [Desulfitobacterium dehalogenans ATCC 51507]